MSTTKFSNVLIRLTVGAVLGVLLQYLMGWSWETYGQRPFLVATLFIWIPVESPIRAAVAELRRTQP